MIETTTIKRTKKSRRSAQAFNLFYGALILAGLNVALLLWFIVTPGWKLNLGQSAPPEPAAATSAGWRPSAFTPVVDVTVTKVRAAAKARPVSLIDEPVPVDDMAGVAKEPPVGADVVKTVYQHGTSDPALRPVNTSRSGNNQGYLRGEEMYRQVEPAADMPRMTAAAYPRRTAAGANEPTAVQQ